MEGPFPPFMHSPRSFRRWLKIAPPIFFRQERHLLGTSSGAVPVDALVSDLLEDGERLLVKRVIYGSPGIKDLVGIGEIVGHIKDLLVRLIDHCSTRRQRSLENERRELENRKLEIEVAKEFVNLAKDVGYTKREMRQLVGMVTDKQRPLVRLIVSGKIISADTVEVDSYASEMTHFDDICQRVRLLNNHLRADGFTRLRNTLSGPSSIVGNRSRVEWAATPWLGEH